MNLETALELMNDIESGNVTGFNKLIRPHKTRLSLMTVGDPRVDGFIKQIIANPFFNKTLDELTKHGFHIDPIRIDVDNVTHGIGYLLTTPTKVIYLWTTSIEVKVKGGFKKTNNWYNEFITKYALVNKLKHYADKRVIHNFEIAIDADWVMPYLDELTEYVKHINPVSLGNYSFVGERMFGGNPIHDDMINLWFLAQELIRSKNPKVEYGWNHVNRSDLVTLGTDDKDFRRSIRVRETGDGGVILFVVETININGSRHEFARPATALLPGVVGALRIANKNVTNSRLLNLLKAPNETKQRIRGIVNKCLDSKITITVRGNTVGGIDIE